MVGDDKTSQDLEQLLRTALLSRFICAEYVRIGADIDTDIRETLGQNGKPRALIIIGNIKGWLELEEYNCKHTKVYFKNYIWFEIQKFQTNSEVSWSKLI